MGTLYNYRGFNRQKNLERWREYTAKMTSGSLLIVMAQLSEVHLPGYYSREVRRNFKRLGEIGMLQFIHFIRLETPPDG